MVAPQEGCLLFKSYSAANGENIKLKWLAKPAEEVKSAERALGCIKERGT